MTSPRAWIRDAPTADALQCPYEGGAYGQRGERTRRDNRSGCHAQCRRRRIVAAQRTRARPALRCPGALPGQSSHATQCRVRRDRPRLVPQRRCRRAVAAGGVGAERLVRVEGHCAPDRPAGHVRRDRHARSSQSVSLSRRRRDLAGAADDRGEGVSGGRRAPRHRYRRRPGGHRQRVGGPGSRRLPTEPRRRRLLGSAQRGDPQS
jgi:hypothetical protein